MDLDQFTPEEEVNRKEMIVPVTKWRSDKQKQESEKVFEMKPHDEFNMALDDSSDHVEKQKAEGITETTLHRKPNKALVDKSARNSLR